MKKKSDKTMWFKTDPTKKSNSPSMGDSNNEKKTYSKVKPCIDLRKTVAVLAIPRSQNGKLVKMLRTAEQAIRSVCTTKIRVVERVELPSNHSSQSQIHGLG